ncbi:MAG: hypothetical protein JO127_07875 [Caulobacteraceae bacterium]|nr:hypothetical protein [Caulobacteraceae bacterium]
MKRAIAALIGLFGVVGGCVMLGAGRWFYAVTPGVSETGPYNPHFVRDIGGAYLAAGLGLVALAWRPAAETRGAAAAGALFLALHAGVHLAEAVGAPSGLADLARDLPAVGLPALLAVWVAWPFPMRAEARHA